MNPLFKRSTKETLAPTLREEYKQIPAWTLLPENFPTKKTNLDWTP